MTDDRTPPSEGRRGITRKRMRPRPASPVAAGAPAAEPPGAESPATGTPAPMATERPVRPWEVDPRAERTAAAEAKRARRDPASLLRDVPEDAVIVARRLTKRYGDFTAVDALDLTIRAGEVFGLLGPNGAGKTTTVLMLLGLTEPTEGVVRVLGLDPTREPLAIKRRVGYLPDDVGFYPGMTGRENLRYTARLNGIPRAEAEETIARLLHEVRLEDAADRAADTYSRGMRQRLGIADALVKGPSVLILDEPTIAIDPAGVEELLALLRRLVAEHRLTVLLSSHILGQVQSLCDRVGFFHQGRLVAAGPLDELARAGGESRYALEVGVDGDPGPIDALAATVPGVLGVAPHVHDPRLRVVTATSDVAAALTVALAEAGQPVVHLRRQGSDLSELYRRFVPEATDGRTR